MCLVIKAFPKFFAKALSFIPHIGIFIRYLPEFISLSKMIIERIKEGWTDAQIKADFKKIDRAFSNPDRTQAARDLNDVFRK